MAINVTSPVTGLAQSGFTSPTYTVTQDSAMGNHSKQWYVSALGGTQTGARAHTVSSPFTVAVFRPQVLKALPAANPITGVIRKVGRNTYKVVTRVGLIPAANQAAEIVTMTTTLDVPPGAETYDAAQLKAALSLHFGVLSQQSAGIGDTAIVGAL